jgi:hypothetical protein
VYGKSKKKTGAEAILEQSKMKTFTFGDFVSYNGRQAIVQKPDAIFKDGVMKTCIAYRGTQKNSWVSTQDLTTLQELSVNLQRRS